MTTQDHTERLPEVEEPAAAQEDQEDAEEAPPPENRRKRHYRRMSLIILTAIAVAAAAGVAATGAFGGGEPSSTPAALSGPAATAKVQRTTLTNSETVEGTLGFGKASTVTDGAAGATGQSGAGSGSAGEIITWVPGEGRTIGRGDAVYRVNERKVPLLYGSIPLYRTLETGSEGSDVLMLERNLKALGYDGFEVNDTYTDGTADAVRDWQDDLNHEETGKVVPGDAVVASGARRVAEIKTSPGTVSGGEVLTWTGTQRIVSVDLDPQHEDLVTEGTKGVVRLPNGSSVQGEVTEIGTPGSAESGAAAAGADAQGADEATLPVEMKIKDQKKLGRYQAATVDVILEADSRKDVLAVPINALVARPGGGYALEVPTAQGSDFLPVELGMFANGLVEVKGDGIKENMTVGVPK